MSTNILLLVGTEKSNKEENRIFNIDSETNVNKYVYKNVKCAKADLSRDIENFCSDWHKDALKYKKETKKSWDDRDYDRFCHNMKKGKWAEFALGLTLIKWVHSDVVINCVKYPAGYGDNFDLYLKLLEISFNTKNSVILKKDTEAFLNGNYKLRWGIGRPQEDIYCYYVTIFENGLPCPILVGYLDKKDIGILLSQGKKEVSLDDLKPPKDLLLKLIKAVSVRLNTTQLCK